MQGNSRHSEAMIHGALTCEAIQDELETPGKSRYVEEVHDKGGQKMTKWRGGGREESSRREMTRGHSTQRPAKTTK